jgi:cytochrome P450
MTMPILPLDLASQSHKTNSHQVYAGLRVSAPVRRVALAGGEEAWLLTRYEDVSRLLKDDRFAKDPANAMTPEMLRRQRKLPSFLLPLTRNMLGLDDPDHARLKKLVLSAFTPNRMELLADRTQRIADGLVEGLKRKGRFDLIADFALPLPVAVISQMLGVPDADRRRFARWSHALISGPESAWSMAASLPGMIMFVRYLRKLIAMKRQSPGDDLVSALIAAEEDGGRLDYAELQAMIAILLSAGHETTTNLIGNGMLALLRHPARRDELAADPGLTTAAVEELLRYDGPVEASTYRYARADLSLHGQLIARGDIVLGSIASANRDEQRFDRPDVLDFRREANRHLTFGEGGHYCVGAALARMEGRVAFQTLLRELPDLRLAAPEAALRWRRNAVLRGLTSLPLAAA